MGQKLQRQYTKHKDQLDSWEREALVDVLHLGDLFKIYVVEDVATGKREIRGNVIAGRGGRRR